MCIRDRLRTGDLYSPWPEEANRMLTSVLTDYHFSPTEASKNNLINEGIKSSNIIVTGNTVIDALKLVVQKIEKDQALRSTLENTIAKSGFDGLNSKFILVTAHRRENFGQGFLNICRALRQLAEKNTDINILYPVHLNPNVRDPVNTVVKSTHLNSN